MQAEPAEYAIPDKPRAKSSGGMSGNENEMLLHKLDAPPTYKQLLGCTCGVDGCSWVIADVTTDGDMVVWANFKSSGTVEDGLPSLGPFKFDRTTERALELSELIAKANSTRAKED